MESRPVSGSAPTVLEPVAFRTGDATLAGNLYVPAAEEEARVPAVVVTGTWTSVKEQMANRYAEELARRGIAALSFDFTGFGLSGGEPREVESPSLKARDIHSAVSLLYDHPSVDRDRIGALAICASAGYAASAAIHNRRLRALALIAPWVHDGEVVRAVYGGERGVRERMEAGEAARKLHVETGVVEYVPVADADNPQAAMPMAIDFYENPRRGAVPGWPNRFAVMAWTEWLTFDAVALAPRVSVPTLLVHSEEAAIPDGAHRFYDGLSCAKDIVWTEGTQFDFYDQEPQVSFSVERAVAHFDRHL